MDNDVFVSKLIKGTKKNKIAWQRDSIRPMTTDFPSYSYVGDKGIVTLYKQEGTVDSFGDAVFVQSSGLKICNSDGDEVTDVLDSDLLHEQEMMRLYRLVERQTNHADDIMEGIVSDIDD